MRRIALSAIVLEVAFLACLAVADVTARRLDLSISQGVHGPLPWLVTLAFVLHAASLALLAGLLRGVPRVAVGVAALGMVMVAGFPTGGAFWVQALHVVGAASAFGGIAVAAATLPRLRALGLVVVVGTVVMAASLAAGAFPVLERVQVVLNGVWLVAVSWSSGAPSSAPLSTGSF